MSSSSSSFLSGRPRYAKNIFVQVNDYFVKEMVQRLPKIEYSKLRKHIKDAFEAKNAPELLLKIPYAERGEDGIITLRDFIVKEVAKQDIDGIEVVQDGDDE